MKIDPTTRAGLHRGNLQSRLTKHAPPQRDRHFLGAYVAAQQLREHVRHLADELADMHAEACYEDEGEAAYGRED